MVKRNGEDLIIYFMENKIDGTDRICKGCPLEGTFCEGAACENSYIRYQENLSYKEVKQEILQDDYLRNKYNNLSIKAKEQFKEMFELN